MAKKLDEKTPGVGHNQMTPEQRNKLIAEVCSGMAQLDDERRAFNAKQSEARKKLTHGIVKGSLAMKVADFNALIYRPYLLKQDEENQEDFDLYQQTMKVAHQFLEIGEQADFVKATAGVKGNGAPKEIEDTLGEAKKKGTAAGKEGKNFDTNPYPEGSQHHKYWAQNWKAAQGKLAQEIKPTHQAAH